MDDANKLKEYPLKENKVLVGFEYSDELKIRSHPLLNTCRILLENDKIVLKGKNISNVTGIKLISHGTYTINSHIIGMVDQGKNDSRRDHMIALVSFTSGKNVMPTRTYMIQSAGEIKAPYDKRIYNYKNRLDLTKPYDVIVERNRYYVEQENETYCMGKGIGVLLVFKYVKLYINYKPIDFYIKIGI